MNKQTFISKRAFTQNGNSDAPMASNQDSVNPMSFDTDTRKTTRSLSRFKKLQNPILVQKVNFDSPLFRQ